MVEFLSRIHIFLKMSAVIKMLSDARNRAGLTLQSSWVSFDSVRSADVPDAEDTVLTGACHSPLSLCPFFALNKKKKSLEVLYKIEFTKCQSPLP